MIKLFLRSSNIFKISFKTMNTLEKSRLPSSAISNFQKIFTPELIALSNLFNKYNYELRIAGGAVRDLLMNKLSADIDFATTATPEEMKAMFEKEHVRLLKTNGEKHGTITCRINDKENFEVTTLRIDVETDGRHAKVKFTRDWQLDAERRDLTINSMFLDLDGFVYDYFGGQTDLLNCRIRFVGNPEARIREDYLRILRYFRFYGRIAKDKDTHEEASLVAIKNNGIGLKGISGERIWVELRKIVTGQFVDSIFRTMHDLGINEFIGLTGDLNFDELDIVHRKSLDLNPNAITLISALLNQQSQLDILHKRVKMSNFELQVATFILKYRDIFRSLHQDNKYDTMNKNKRSKTDLDSESIQDLHFTENDSEYYLNLREIEDPLFELCRDLILDPSVATQGLTKTKSLIEELLIYADERLTLQKVREWQPPRFPVDGTKLIEIGVPKGPEFSRVLKRLRNKWKESRYMASQEELLTLLKEKYSN